MARVLIAQDQKMLGSSPTVMLSTHCMYEVLTYS